MAALEQAAPWKGLGLAGTLCPHGAGKGTQDRPMGGAPCSNEPSASADVGMASGVGSPLLEVADAPGSTLAGRGAQDDEQSVPSQKTKLVTADKFAVNSPTCSLGINGTTGGCSFTCHSGPLVPLQGIGIPTTDK